MRPGSSAPEPDPSPLAGDSLGEGERRVARFLALVALAAAAAYLVVRLLQPFLPGLVTAGVVATLILPLHRRVERRLRQPTVAAFLTTTVVFLLVLLPLSALTGLLVQGLVGGSEALARELEGLLAPGGRLEAWLEGAAGTLGVDPATLVREGQDQVRNAAAFLARRSLGFFSGLGGWLLQAGVALFTLYYLLRDASELGRAVTWILPLATERTTALEERTREVIHATVYGIVVVALVQGLLGGLAFWWVGIPGAAVWGTVMGLLSLLPAVGVALVWLPGGVILLAQGRVADGVTLLAFGTFVISTVDNLLRALLVSERAHLHPLVVFFSLLGGLAFFGAAGVFVGPVLVVLGLSVITMARMSLLPGEVPEHLPWGILRGPARTPDVPESTPDAGESG